MFVTDADDEMMRALMRRARLLLFPQVEDFGIIAAEAQACGLPVVARRAGGALDTVVDPLRQVETEGFSNNLRVARAVDQRASLLTAGRVLDGAALDKYSFMRDGYLQRRRNLVWDGDPPPEREPAETESK